jgi:excinuclease ABC subunit A
MKSIIIKGAREHNLKNIDLNIPRDKFTVITGVSGSGKSSLAFDTIYAEGQRRYVESLSTYARQFLEQMKKPDVDLITGLSPAISIQQKYVSKNPRSTVGTITEIYDYLRLLHARIGQPYCYKCGRIISSQTVEQIVDSIMAFQGSINILAPLIEGRKGEYIKELEELRRAGYIRVKVNGHVLDLANEIKLDKNKKHYIDVFVDRITIKDGIKNRLTDSVENALKLGRGVIKIEIINNNNTEEKLFSEKFACLYCNISFPELTPQMFSFNSPTGACPECNGLGSKMYFDPRLIVPDENKSLHDGAVLPWGKRDAPYYYQLIKNITKNEFKFDISTPFKDLPQRVKDIVMNGTTHDDEASENFEGIVNILQKRWRFTESDYVREELERFMNYTPCPLCHGARLKKESLSVKIGKLAINEFCALSITEAINFLDNLKLSKKEETIAERLLKEIKNRLKFLLNVGLEYLTLSRLASTLSGGESQRIRLATQIGSNLVGVVYILDEPSIGLHARDNKKLIDTLLGLRDLGNTVIVVEHDANTILSADYVIDLGPGAGKDGGFLVSAGMPKEIIKDSKSLTGKYLSGVLNISIEEARRKGNGKFLEVKNARGNNLKDISVKFPLGTFICVTGVSGSGKSSLVIDTLYKYLASHFYNADKNYLALEKISGLEHIDKVIDVDQSPIGRTPRSNPATYTGLFTPIRELFSTLPESRMRGYLPGRFSFNVKGGRCESCEGDGIIRIEMHFLPDVYVQCELCQGKRYNRETLEIKYRGKNIYEVLNLTIIEAIDFFKNMPLIKNKLDTLRDVGLGYIELGQFATTLSGGEAQRIKLAKELSKRSTGRTLYILDEPTTGLHFDDIKKLLGVLMELVKENNTVIVIEHNLDVIKTADWIIDLGPEGGAKGGYVVATGTPEELKNMKDSYTGQALRSVI